MIVVIGRMMVIIMMIRLYDGEIYEIDDTQDKISEAVLVVETGSSSARTIQQQSVLRNPHTRHDTARRDDKTQHEHLESVSSGNSYVRETEVGSLQGWAGALGWDETINGREVRNDEGEPTPRPT